MTHEELVLSEIRKVISAFSEEKQAEIYRIHATLKAIVESNKPSTGLMAMALLGAEYAVADAAEEKAAE